MVSSTAHSQIEKDLRRTQPNSATFQNILYLSKLKETLLTYHQIDPEVGYMQGMNIVASIVVYHSRSVSESVEVFAMVMRKCNLREIYIEELSHARKHCHKIMILLRNKCNDLYVHLMERK